MVIAIDISEKLKLKKGITVHEVKTSEFIVACRCYNRALSFHQFIMKTIDDHFLLNSLSKFVKVVKKDNKVKA